MSIPDSWFTVYTEDLEIVVEHEDKQEAIKLAQEQLGKEVRLIVEGYSKYSKNELNFINGGNDE